MQSLRNLIGSFLRVVFLLARILRAAFGSAYALLERLKNYLSIYC